MWNRTVTGAVGVSRDVKVRRDNATLRALFYDRRWYNIRDSVDIRVNPGATPATGKKGADMRKRTRLKYIAITALLAVLLPTVAFAASSIINSKWYGTIVISNNSTANTSVATVANISTQNFIDGGYLNATANNCVMRNSSGADVPFMPAYTPSSPWWCFWVPDIGDNSYLTYLLYTDNSFNGELRYFPGAAGMITADNASLEFADNFSYKTAGFFDATASGPILSKPEAVLITGSGTSKISATIPTTEPITMVPSGFANWVEMDFSSYIPANATGVVLEVNANAKDCGFRKKGSTDNRVEDTFHNWLMIGVDANGIAEVYLEDNTVGLFLVGYTDSNWTFKTNADDISLDAFSAWTDIDVTAITSTDCTGVIVEAECIGGQRNVGWRNDGSADNRFPDMALDSHLWFIVGVDEATEIFEGYAETTQVDFFLIGYCEGGSTWKVNADDKSLIPVGAWTDIDCSVEAPNASYLFWEVDQTAVGADDYGFRYNNAAHAELGLVDRQRAAAITACDSGQIVDGWITNIRDDFFLLGYATSGIYNPGVGVTVTVASGERTIEFNADGVNMELMVDRGQASQVSDNAVLAAPIPDSGSDYTSFVNYVMPYVEYQTIHVGGNEVQNVYWEYDTVFTDHSTLGTNPATPSFRTASSDLDVIGNMTAFTPISQAQAPGYTLGAVNPFIESTPNITGEFTIVPPVGTFPLAGVIAAIAGATATPPQLPLLIIAGFMIIAASLTISYTMRKYGSGSIIVKSFVIIGMMGIFIALGDFGIDWWMIVVFSIIATAIAMMSRHTQWN